MSILLVMTMLFSLLFTVQSIGAADAELVVIAPKNGSVVDDETVVFEANVPSSYTSVAFSVDGRSIANVTNNETVYTASLARAELGLGMHTFTVVASDGSQTKTATSKFETASWIGNVINVVNSTLATTNQNVTIVEGKDGTSSGTAFSISSTSNLYNSYSKFDTVFERGVAVLDTYVKIPAENAASLELRATPGSGDDVYLGIDKSAVKHSIISGDGYVANTSVKCTPDVWHHLRIETQLITGASKVYFDRELISEVDISDANSGNLNGVKISALKLWFGQNQMGKSISFDSMKIGITNLRLLSTQYSTDNNTTYTVSSDGIISEDTTHIKFEINDTLYDGSSTTIAAEKVLINGVPAGKVVNGTGTNPKTIVIALPELLKPGKDYVITFSDDLYWQNAPIGYSLTCHVKTAGEKWVDTIEPLVTNYYSSDDVVASSVNIIRAEESSLPEEVVLIIAAYKDDCLVSLNSKKITLNEGLNELFVKTSYNGGNSYKGFLWLNLETAIPLTGAK